MKSSNRKTVQVLFLVGPTAVGKTEIAFHLARLVNAEILCCDSMQIYRGIPIVTDMPSPQIRERIAHHLFDFYPISEEFNVVRFVDAALAAITQIQQAGAMPLFVGGSGLYMKVVLDGIFQESSSASEVRERLDQEAEQPGGVQLLYQRLRQVDASVAGKISSLDVRRIARALEVYEVTGRPLSEWQKQAKGIWGTVPIRIFGLYLPKDVLIERIVARVDTMLASGLIEEVKYIFRSNPGRTVLQAIGVGEVQAFIAGKIDYAQMRGEIIRRTTYLVKKQMTWFLADSRIEWILCEEHPSEVIAELIRSALYVRD